MPQRIQMKRTKGWRKPPGAVYVGRPTKWGNPHKIGDPEIPTAQAAVNAYRDGISKGAFPIDDIEKLRGKDLACWCPLDQPCHADVLLKLANS